MGKMNEKSASSESLRGELRDVDEAIATLEAQVSVPDADVKRLLLPSPAIRWRSWSTQPPGSGPPPASTMTTQRGPSP